MGIWADACRVELLVRNTAAQDINGFMVYFWIRLPSIACNSIEGKKNYLPAAKVYQSVNRQIAAFCTSYQGNCPA